MSRKAKAPAHENHERWLVSYADFITLLFAFFVVMFASSNADKSRAKQVSESVTKALQEGKVSETVARVLGNGKLKGTGPLKDPGNRGPATGDLRASLELLAQQLKEEIAAGKLQLKMDPRGLIVSLTEAAFFPSGEDTIVPSAYGTIGKIAAVIRKVPNPVRLEGHTDSIPIHNSHFRNNWELSAARSIAMLDLMTSRFSVAETQLAVAGYADTSPVDTNDTADGRARNRRVDIVILNQLGNQNEPVQSPPSAPRPTVTSGPVKTAAGPPPPPGGVTMPEPSPQPAPAKPAEAAKTPAAKPATIASHLSPVTLAPVIHRSGPVTHKKR